MMFERYSERARRVLFFARYEASHFGSTAIGTEHILMGLAREGKGVLTQLLAELNVTIDDIRSAIEARIAAGKNISTSVEIPFNAEAKRALQDAAEESDRLLHRYIGPEHLLLGLLRQEDSIAGSILYARGLRLDDARARVVQWTEKNFAPGSAGFVSMQAEQLHTLIDVIGQLVDQLAALPPGEDAEAIRHHVVERLEALRKGIS